MQLSLIEVLSLQTSADFPSRIVSVLPVRLSLNNLKVPEPLQMPSAQITTQARVAWSYFYNAGN